MAVADLADLSGEDHRVEHLDNRDGTVAVQHRVGAGDAVGAAEALGLAAAAVEHDALGEDGKPRDGRRAGAAQNGVADDAVIECDVDGVVAALVAQRIHIHVREQQLRAAGLCAGGAVQNGLGFGGEIDAQIVHAILVKAGVYDLVRMDAGRAGITTDGRIGAFVCHKKTSC